MTDELVEVAEDSARGGFFLVSGNALAMVIMAFGSILVGRLLGPELYGQYALALVVPQLLFLFTDLGINQAIIRFAASLRATGEVGRVTRIIQSGMLLRVIIGMTIFAVNFALAGLFAVFLNRPNIAMYIQIASISIIFQVVYTTVASASVGLDKTEYNALTVNIHATVKTTLSIILVLLGFSVTGAIIGHVGGYIIASIIGAGILFFKLLNLSRGCEKDSFVKNFRILASYGMPLYVSILLIGFLPLYQNLMLAFFTTGYIDIGNFKAATNFIALISVLSMSITTALLPAFSKLNSSTSEKIKSFFKLANKYTCLLVIPTTTLIIIFSKEIVQIIYGSAFQSAPLFLATYCPLFFLVAIGYLNLTSLFNGLGETRITLKMTFINFLVFIVLAPVLSKTYGVIGLIVASLISNATATSYASYMARASFKIEFATRSIIKIYLVSAMSGIPSLMLLHFTSFPELFNIIVGGALYFLIYATLTPLTQIISNSELQTVTYIVEKIRPLTLIAKPLLKYQGKILDMRANT